MLKVSSVSPSESAVACGYSARCRRPARAAAPATAGALVEAYRDARLPPRVDRSAGDDPRERSLIAELDPRTYGLSDRRIDRLLAGLRRQLRTSSRSSALLSLLREAYCGSVAIDCAHVRANEQRRWLHARMETRSGWPDPLRRRLRARPRPAGGGGGIRAASSRELRRLQAVQPGGKREHRHVAARDDRKRGRTRRAKSIVLGMPHRGRLNMMLNALDVPAQKVLSLFSANPDVALAARDLEGSRRPLRPDQDRGAARSRSCSRTTRRIWRACRRSSAAWRARCRTARPTLRRGG